MAVVETEIGSSRKFVSGTITAFGEVNKEKQTATLKMPDKKNFVVPETTKINLQAYSEILTAFNAWAASQLT